MKKRLVPLLCILFLLTGCAAQSSPLMGKISSELSSVVMTRYDCEGQTEISLADEENKETFSFRFLCNLSRCTYYFKTNGKDGFLTLYHSSGLSMRMTWKAMSKLQSR